MLNGLASGGVSFLLVFLEGLLSFFSPCVIPLLPVYMGYLAGTGHQNTPNSPQAQGAAPVFQRKIVFLHTLFFVLGISFAFFLLGLGFTTLGRFFAGQRTLMSRIGGILIVLLGLFQVGFLELPFLQRERRLHPRLGKGLMNPFTAFVMGFTFSFAWTPCVGPALSSVLLMASGAQSRLLGNLLVLVYALGFVLPFLALGLFTARILDFFRNNRRFLAVTVKLGGVVLILMGIMTFTGWMNGITGYLSSFGQGGGGTPPSSQSIPPTPPPSQSSSATPSSSEASELSDLVDFTLTDQAGVSHTLSDYKGKVVFLNFWATWCGPCKKEMPHIQALYDELGENGEEVIFLGVANPKTEANPQNADVSTPDVKAFLETNGYTFPTVMDESGEVFAAYGVSAFPTTFIITPQGKILGYVSGTMTKEMMESIIAQGAAAA